MFAYPSQVSQKHPPTTQLLYYPEPILCLPPPMATSTFWVNTQSWLTKHPHWPPPNIPDNTACQQCLCSKNKHSGFAWIISRNHTMLWHRAGLAPGPAEDIYSERVEAYGILVATMFLSYYVKCYDSSIPPTMIKCFCDNAGIINTLCSLQMDHIPQPNNMTNNDRDIFMEIHATTLKASALQPILPCQGDTRIKIPNISQC